MIESVRALVRVSAAIGRGDRAAVKRALEAAAASAPAGEIEEMLLQSHLFVGYPAMLQAIAAWRGLAVGGNAPESAPDDSLDASLDDSRGDSRDGSRDDAGEWQARGERVCATIYGDQYDRLRENVVRLHPVLDGWMVADGYGRVLGRAGLTLVTRELCIVALLCAQDVPEQLYAHLRGALNAGASSADVEETVALSVGEIAEERRAGARARWEVVKSRAG